MAEDGKSEFKDMDWKVALGDAAGSMNNSGEVVIKKRLPRKIRQVPDYYFMPRIPWPKAFAIYGATVVAGVGAGMLVDVWLKKKMQEDDGVVWEY